jgi:hypothetical protein
MFFLRNKRKVPVRTLLFELLLGLLRFLELLVRDRVVAKGFVQLDPTALLSGLLGRIFFHFPRTRSQFKQEHDAPSNRVHYMRCNNCDLLLKFPPGVFLRDKNLTPCLGCKKEKMRKPADMVFCLRSVSHTSSRPRKDVSMVTLS